MGGRWKKGREGEVGGRKGWSEKNVGILIDTWRRGWMDRQLAVWLAGRLAFWLAVCLSASPDRQIEGGWWEWMDGWLTEGCFVSLSFSLSSSASLFLFSGVLSLTNQLLCFVVW